jgi:hypothetical protein
VKEVTLKRVVFLKEEELREVVKEYVEELRSSGVVENVSEQEWRKLLYGLWGGFVHGNRVEAMIIDIGGSRIEVDDCFAFARVIEWLFGGLDEIVKEN